MKKHMLTLVFLLLSICCNSQSTEKEILDSIINLGVVELGNEDFSSFSELKNLLEGVEIVMMGEQSHGEATAYETKIKLIKYLHQELDFEILLFESGFYSCHKAWELIENGEDIKLAMGKSVFTLWSALKDIRPLVGYIEGNKDSHKPLKLLGFDSQFTGRLASDYFLKELSDFLQPINADILESEDWAHFATNIIYLTNFGFKSLKKNNPSLDLAFIDSLILDISKAGDILEKDYWIQVLKSTHSYISDIGLKTDFRDKQMAENLIWIKNKYPDSKIICWGATSHFLYNSQEVKMKSGAIQLLAGNYYKKHKMMGDYIKEEYQDKVYTIGFTAYEGEYGLWRRRKLKAPKKKTLELLLGKSKYDIFLVPLKGLNLEGYRSRPLGNFYMKNPINEVMDAVIFNRHMKGPKLDNNFFLELFPENKYIKPKPEAML